MTYITLLRFISLVIVASVSTVFSAYALANDNDWKVANPASVGLNSEILNNLDKFIRQNPQTNIHSILIIKDDRLVFEKYFSGKDEDWGDDLGTVVFEQNTRHDMRSISKSVTSALVGIAISEGVISNTHANALTLFPEYSEQMSPDKSKLTLHHILTMTSGLDWFEPSDYTNQGNDEIRMDASKDPVAFTLGRSFSNLPGEIFQYNGGLPTLLGYILEKGYGKNGVEIAREKLFTPLGIKEFDWHSNSSGLLAYASGLRLTPRDIAKIGSLYLNDGMWRGQRILQSDWVEASTKPHTTTDWTAGYGYQWWIPRFASDDKSFWVPAGIGNGGQRMFVVKPLNLIFIMTAGNYNMSESSMALAPMDIMTNYIFPAAGFDNLKFMPSEN